MIEFLKPNDPALWSVSPAVRETDVKSNAVQADIAQMVQIAFGNQGDRKKPVMVGLAAPQIGIARRIILVDVAAEGHGTSGDVRVYVNPEITWSSNEKTEWYEGCYSTDCVCGIVSRPTKIRVEAMSSDGKSVIEEHTGYTARIFQHEIDHLDGVEFISHIVDDAKLHWVEDSMYPEYRNQEGWRKWSVLCSRDQWNRIKGQN